MPCYHPLRAYNLIGKKTKTGKNLIVFKDNQVTGPYTNVDLPCGQCIGCKIDKSRDWAIRNLHEASTYGANNCFLTLTIDDKHLNETGTLDPKYFTNFMKEMRRQYNGEKAVAYKNKLSFPIRFFHCGEYGEACRGCGQDRKHCYCRKYIPGIGRPHHHVLLFNFDFPDKDFQKNQSGHNWYNSEILSKIWKKGFHSIGDVTYQSAAYVARYITKKITGKKAEEHYKRCDSRTAEIHNVIPEYITMSRQPGIGKQWYEKFKKDIFPKDFLINNGKKIKIPKFYNKMFEETYPKQYDTIKKERKVKANDRKADSTIQRLNVRHRIAISKNKQLKRRLK